MWNYIGYISISFFVLFSCAYDTLEPTTDCNGRITLQLGNVANTSCGLNQGSIEIIVANPESAVGALAFSIDGGENFQNTGVFTDLSAGDYTIEVSDDECNETIAATIVNEDGLNASISATDSECGEGTSIITLDVSDAVGVVLYSLNGGPTQTESSFTDLPTGDYTVTVSDESGCSIDVSVSVESSVTYSDVETIVRSNCAISGCHAGNVSPDFRNKNTIIDRAQRILSRTGARSMPPRSSGISLTAQQIEAIECWVADGAEG